MIVSSITLFGCFMMAMTRNLAITASHVGYRYDLKTIAIRGLYHRANGWGDHTGSTASTEMSVCGFMKITLEEMWSVQSRWSS